MLNILRFCIEFEQQIWLARNVGITIQSSRAERERKFSRAIRSERHAFQIASHLTNQAIRLDLVVDGTTESVRLHVVFFGKVETFVEVDYDLGGVRRFRSKSTVLQYQRNRDRVTLFEAQQWNIIITFIFQTIN